jgi:DNA-binding NtrC family response regulator
MLATSPRAAARHCVLVVEDEVLVRIGIAGALRDAGVQVIEAGNAQEALSVLQARPEVRLVFSDIRMPGEIDGLGLAQIIDRQFAHLKVVLTSAVPPKAFGGMFVPKPYDLERLVVSLARMLD